MNPGLDYEKLKQESDELDGLKGIADFTFDFGRFTDRLVGQVFDQ